VKIGAVVLAAGGSRRLGEPKQLLTYKGQTLVRRTAAAALAVCSPVVVVVGHDRERISASLCALPLTIVPNESWESGIGSSLRCGLAALTTCDAVAVLVCDQPMVDADVIRCLVHEKTQTGKPIAASAYSGSLGVPAVFERRFFAALQRLPDNEGAKSLISGHRDEVAPVDFAGGAIDIDRPVDLKLLDR
jgi:molybdenum cofactor cytidylyltransferase